jgi:hypothetical protein
MEAPAGLNQIWALDFMIDALYGRRAFRTLNLIDEGRRPHHSAYLSILCTACVRQLRRSLVSPYRKNDELLLSAMYEELWRAARCVKASVL